MRERFQGTIGLMMTTSDLPSEGDALRRLPGSHGPSWVPNFSRMSTRVVINVKFEALNQAYRACSPV